MSVPTTRIEEIGTPGGMARLHLTESLRPDGERARLLLGHGAGGGAASPDLLALAERLPAAGVTVLRLEQPWRVAGRRLAGPWQSLDRAQMAVIDQLPAGGGDGSPLVLGGRSAGARSACRVAAERTCADLPPPIAGVVCLAFPLHPPVRAGRDRDPEKSRAGELARVTAAGLPLHVVQGSRDAFGSAEDVRAAPWLRHGVVSEIPLADHSFVVPKRSGAAAGTSTAAAIDQVVEAVSAALEAILGAASGGLTE